MKRSPVSIAVAAAALAVLCGCGGGNAEDAVASISAQQASIVAATPSASTLDVDVTLPGFVHRIDFYEAEGADKAIVFLHGGGGSKEHFAYNLGLNTRDAPPTQASTNWAWLEGRKVLAVFPQGQSLPEAAPATTWNNHVMDSGQNDVAFLQALAAHIKRQYGIDQIHVVGHSNGGMMVNRMWCESPDTFGAHVALAGPPSDYYLAPATPCTPALKRPYLGVVGALDSMLQVPGHWDDPTWTLDPSQTGGPAFVDPVLAGEWRFFQGRAAGVCAELAQADAPHSMATVEAWRACGGRLQLQKWLNADHDLNMPAANGQSAPVLDAAYAFIMAQSGE
jgi:poly(3-hydroxybutyrate) depolymerase